MLTRGQNFKKFPLNITGSSTFGRYPKISVEKTYNMFNSDGWLVDYAGYAKALLDSLGTEGRGLHTSTQFNRLIAVVDSNVYLINLFFDQDLEKTFDSTILQINKDAAGNVVPLATTTGDVFITENLWPQIVISDGANIWYYGTLIGNTSPTWQQAFQDTSGTGLNFTPGFIDFHNTYILVAAKNDLSQGGFPAQNVWRLGIVDSASGKLIFPSQAANVGLLQTKPDVIQAVVRFPSAGNMILVMGKVVTEFWFDQGLQLFPYQRSTSLSVDYGCLNPSTIAALDNYVVWLAFNEKSGPIIMYTTGTYPKKITTDGIDYLFSQLKNPSDSQAFLYRQDGHLFYHINFYTDNLSLFYDFNTEKFYHACDENLNYFIANDVAFFNNQYYFLTNNNGNLYAFDTIYTTYDGAEIPRIRVCKNVRDISQEYFIANDVGFTIETGETPYQQQTVGPIFLITQDSQFIITQGKNILFVTQDNQYLLTQDDNNIASQQFDITDFDFLISQQPEILNITPRVDLSISIDGGVTFSSDFPYNLNPLAQRRNKLLWWQIGLANDLVCQFRFWGLGRFVASDGEVNVRQ